MFEERFKDFSIIYKVEDLYLNEEDQILVEQDPIIR